MKMSHIICSRNRAAQLEFALSKLNPEALARHNVELVLVDNASDDATLTIMQNYAKQSRAVTRVVQAEQVGRSIALNVGVRASCGDLVIFTDDDCYLEENYYEAILKEFDPAQHQYGTGQVLLFDPSDDRRIAIRPIAQKYVIPPGSFLPAGAIQGPNMFFLRCVFERIGYFCEVLGSGALFKSASDTEFSTRASLGGFSGVLLPSVIVYHHHKRKPGSAKSDATLRGYDTGRGAYYAIGLIHGVSDVWPLWRRSSESSGPMSDALAAKLEREFRGAADYLKYHLEKKRKAQG